MLNVLVIDKNYPKLCYIFLLHKQIQFLKILFSVFHSTATSLLFDIPLSSGIYTVYHKKGTALFLTITLAVFDRFLIILLPVETEMNTSQYYVIYLLNC